MLYNQLDAANAWQSSLASVRDYRAGESKRQSRSEKRMKGVLMAIIALTLYVGLMLSGNPGFVQIQHGCEWAVVVWDVTNHITIEQGANLDTMNGMTMWTTISFPRG